MRNKCSFVASFFHFKCKCKKSHVAAQSDTWLDSPSGLHSSLHELPPERPHGQSGVPNESDRGQVRVPLRGLDVDEDEPDARGPLGSLEFVRERRETGIQPVRLYMFEGGSERIQTGIQSVGHMFEDGSERSNDHR